jgi:FkbM family methyltransferase
MNNKNYLRVINRILKPFRLRAHPITPGQLLIEALVRKRRPIKFIQVGANDGLRFDNLYSTVTDQGWSGVAIEPLSKYFIELVNNYKNYQNVIPVNCGIHHTLREAKIYSVSDSALDLYPSWIDGCASMNREHLVRAGVSSHHIIESAVKCVQLMEVVDSYNMYDADYLQVDTEGFDAEVLKMIDFKKIKPLVIKFEWIHLSPQDQADTRSLLHSNGYKLEVNKDGLDCCAWLSNKLSL